MKTALITGASSGLGREFVKHIALTHPEIERYILVARRRERLLEYETILNKKDIIALSLDLRDKASYEALSSALNESAQELSLLINCAGYGILGDFYESNLEEQTGMTELNVTALTAVTNIALPHMSAGSVIINVSSIASFVPTPRMAVYCSTKAYVQSFSKALKNELKSRKINVLALCPGPMDTEFLSVGRIEGNSKTFDILPRVSPSKAASGALKAAFSGKGVYTPRTFYKTYRVLAKMIPQRLFMHFTRT